MKYNTVTLSQQEANAIAIGKTREDFAARGDVVENILVEGSQPKRKPGRQVSVSQLKPSDIIAFSANGVTAGYITKRVFGGNTFVIMSAYGTHESNTFERDVSWDAVKKFLSVPKRVIYTFDGNKDLFEWLAMTMEDQTG